MTDKNEQLDRIEKLLAALLAIELDKHLREYPLLGSSKAGKIEHILSGAGLSGKDIAKLLGKSPQAVSQNLARPS